MIPDVVVLIVGLALGLATYGFLRLAARLSRPQ